MRVFSWQWWVTIIIVLVAGCSDSTAPEMKPLTLDGYVEPWVSKHYRAGGGICEPGTDNDSPTNKPAVHVCFMEFAKALGISGATIGLCYAQAQGAATAAGAIGRWGGCLAGTIASLESWQRWLDATQVDGLYDWSERELRNRMWEATFARCGCGRYGQDR